MLGKKTDCRYDAWILGQWYIELTLLRLFGYTGSYSDRLRRGVWKSEAVERVPWMAQSEGLEERAEVTASGADNEH